MSDIAQPPFWAAWGKSSGRSRPHPLICHLLDTAAVAERIFTSILGPTLSDGLQRTFEPLGEARTWIAVLCGLHDLGKYIPSFQSLNFELASNRLGPVAVADMQYVARQTGIPRTDIPHGLVTAMDLHALLISWGASPETANLTAVALGGHHGYFPNAGAISQARLQVNSHGGEFWYSWRDSLVREIARLWGIPDPRSLPWDAVHLDIAGAVGLAALASISDWIASDPTNFPPAIDEPDLTDYLVLAKQQASAAVRRLNLRPWRAKDASFSALFPSLDPRPVQRVMEQLCQDLDEPAILVVEAPTGEGKSAVAIQAAAAIAYNLGLLGCYIAMPTQATGNQMYEDFAEVLDQLGGARPHLVHSRAAEYLADSATTPTGISEDERDDHDKSAQEWFTRKRSLLAPIGVGTVDQILKAGIRSGHVVVRLAALSNKVVVIDEVHAYDTYMSTLLDRLLMWLGRLGVAVILMSATLPTGRRDQLVAAWQAGRMRCRPAEVPTAAVSTIHPRITLATRGTPTTTSVGTSELNHDRKIRLDRVAEDQIVDWVLAQAGTHGCVAVVHNLVRRVVATSEELSRRIACLPAAHQPELIVITGRMPAQVRRDTEARLRGAFGFEGSRPHAIVVGTQVLEQSLDLDFDAMLSDLAPVDLLLQRTGRLHRHRRRGVPTLGITGVTDHPAGPSFPQYLHTVYEPMILLRTWALIRHRQHITTPDVVPPLVNAVYGPPDAVACPPGWEAAWNAAEERLQRAHAKDNHDARLLYLPPPHAVDHLDELTVRPKNPGQTRKGHRQS